jgi:hypothetical protein
MGNAVLNKAMALQQFLGKADKEFHATPQHQ